MKTPSSPNVPPADPQRGGERRPDSQPAATGRIAAQHRRFEMLVAVGRTKLARALRTLVNTTPFHGHIASGWRARPDVAIETMGVTWACGGIQLVWNPEFVSRISELELAGVLAHEANHVALRHPFMFAEQANPGPTFDLHAAIVAEEITANEFVSLPLPGQPMLLEHFTDRHPQLAAFQSTRERYRLLYDPARAQHHHEEREKFKKTLQQQMDEMMSALRAAGGGHLPDSHEGWGSFRQSGAAAALAAAVATGQALDLHGDTLSSELRELIRNVHASAGGPPGMQAGGMLEKLAGKAQARLSWQTILRRLLAVDHESEPTYLRAPRRFPDMAGVLPGRRRVPTKLRILAAIDTSGSMASTTLDEIAAELRVMARSFEVSVVEFDVVIQRRYRLSQKLASGAGSAAGANAGDDPLAAMQGRGGTSFVPVFEQSTLDWAADGADLSGVVLFSDGYGPAPEHPPRVPVIWVLMGHGVRTPAPWGTVVNASANAGADSRR